MVSFVKLVDLIIGIITQCGMSIKNKICGNVDSKRETFAEISTEKGKHLQKCCGKNVPGELCILLSVLADCLINKLFT